MKPAKYGLLRLFSHRKGITPIISIILLLMMTIAIAGLSFTFIQRVQISVEDQTESTSRKLVSDLTTFIRIEGGIIENCGGGDPVLGDATIFFRNTGVIDAHSPQLFVNNEFIDISDADFDTIEPGPVFNFTADDLESDGSPDLSNVPWNGTLRLIKISTEEGVFQGSFKFICTD